MVGFLFFDYVRCYYELFLAEGRREYVKDSLYSSHASNGVLTFHVYSKSFMASGANIQVSQIHVIDLSGVDTIGNLTCFYKSIYEIGSANLTKSQLEQFLMILIENVPESVLIKQRLNILVLYLKDCLNGSSLLR